MPKRGRKDATSRSLKKWDKCCKILSEAASKLDDSARFQLVACMGLMAMAFFMLNMTGSRDYDYRDNSYDSSYYEESRKRRRRRRRNFLLAAALVAAKKDEEAEEEAEYASSDEEAESTEDENSGSSAESSISKLVPREIWIPSESESESESVEEPPQKRRKRNNHV